MSTRHLSSLLALLFIAVNFISAASAAPPEEMKMRRDKHHIYFENQYISWRHDAVTGELNGAFVRHGANSNLLMKPLKTVVILTDPATALNANMRRGKGGITRADDRGIAFEYALELNGKVVNVSHRVEYKPWGSAAHAVTISAPKPVDNVFGVHVLHTTFAPRMDRFTWRPTLEAGVGTWAQNNTPMWLPLHGGTRQQDMLAFCAKRIPLSCLILQRGVDGIEFSLGGNLEEWHAFRPAKMQPSQEAQLAYYESMDGYRFFVAPYFGRQDGVIHEARTFHFNLTLPLVRAKMSPLRTGGHLLLGKSFAERWPDEERIRHLQASGADIFRLHNDGDNFSNGIFWRDAAYPPYPAEEMAKMDKALAMIHKHRMKAVPYFSLKEFHPEVKDFEEFSEVWARRDEPEGAMRINRLSGNRIFGAQMCLKSGWKTKRMATIREALENHAFDGIYFDWCMGLECFGKAHCGFWHWDNDEFTELLQDVRNLLGKDGEMYLHTSYVPSLASENMATLLLTEEVACPRIGPEMFSPHVHFMNTAPRQICNMLNKPSDKEQKQLAMCALLHHATVSDTSEPILELYRENRYWMDTVVNYNRHHAPGEGWTLTDNEEVGFAYYEDGNGGRLHVFANLSDREVTVNWKTPKDGRTGTITLPPMKITVEKR